MPNYTRDNIPQLRPLDLIGSRIKLANDPPGSNIDPGEPSPPFDWSNNDYWTRNTKGMTLSPQGIGTGLAGIGALTGAMLPGKDTAWWKRMLYGLLGAGVLGSAGYLGSDMLSQGKGWTLPWGIGATPSPEAEAGGEDAPSTEE